MTDVQVSNARRIGFTALALVVFLLDVEFTYREVFGYWQETGLMGQSGAHHIFHDYWADFYHHIPECERDNMVAAYHRRLTGDDEIARMAAAKIWSQWEGRTATLLPNASVRDHFTDPHVALSLARIECDYFYNNCWLEPNQLLRDAQRLHDIPGVIVHGRYDVVCPVIQAFELHAAWPQAELQIIPEAGHAASVPGISAALVRATNKFARLLARG